MRRLDGITTLKTTYLNKLWVRMKGKEACHAAVHVVTKELDATV